MVATHTITIQNPKKCPTFTYIKKGIKTVEGRKNSDKYQKIKEGDLLIFECEGEKLKTRVTYVHRYTTVVEYLETETLARALPCAKSIKQGVDIYNLWSSAEEREALRQKTGFGFLGIGIELLHPPAQQGGTTLPEYQEYLQAKRRYQELKEAWYRMA